MQTAFFKNRWIESLILLEKEKIMNLFVLKSKQHGLGPYTYIDIIG